LYQAALQNYDEIGDRRGQASALQHLGRVHAAAGGVNSGMEEFERSFALRKDAGIRDSAAESLSEMGRVLESRGDLENAGRRLSEAIQLVETLRSNVPGDEFRAFYFASKQPYYERYIDLQMRMDRPAGAFNTAEQARGRALLDLIFESRNRIQGDISPALRAQQLRLERQLNFKSQQIISMSRQPTNAEHEAPLRSEIDKLLAEYNLVEAEIRQQSPRYAGLWQPHPATLEEIQKLLNEDTALLEFSLGESRSYLWAVTHDRLDTYILPGRAVVERAVKPVIELVASARARDRDPALQRRFDGVLAESGRVLLEYAGTFRAKKRWIIVSDGILQYLPFAALRFPYQSSPASGHEIRVLPSASLITELETRKMDRQRAQKTVAIFADPVFDALDPRVGGLNHSHEPPRSSPAGDSRSATGWNLARLPFSQLEVKSISDLVPAKDLLIATGFAATKNRLMGPDIAKYRILHLSTHALLNDSYPQFSGVALSQVDPDGRSQDGFLRLYEIYNLHLAGTELVVLSACKTGLGKEIRGEGLVGVARGFLYAGADRVLVSLWEVEDEATAELMRRFYDALLGKQRLGPAAALATAQASMRAERRWQDPYYWAGFTLISGQD
jgi:CHAT domain-containing protein